MSQLKQYYLKEVVSKLTETFKYKNIMQVPKLEKVVLNMGLGEAIHNIKLLDSASEELMILSGQKPVITRAKKSIAAFKLREGMPIGCMVTLRSRRMYDFYYKLVNIALPRVRDFRGLSGNAMDGHGNYTLGIKEHIIFPEIDYDKIDKIKGINITVVTTAETDEEGKELLRLLGMPFSN
ncbi:MAG: 50S ribosomal protein L5 [Deltaproteobacteria bacterium]|jgi:large subunit ribosomal protein L5|nr:50S ribosomal protein L5 [Deltaproteobacteria bacterium]